MTNQKDVTSYDELPYPSYTFPKTHPDRLATLATLHGLTPARPSKCRYLELGCGDGTNIVSSASVFADSEFLAIDLSERHIERATKTASELGVINARFLAADIVNVTASDIGQFDYVVAHGLFSWVPDNVRDHVLDLMSECLVENGIGYISYHTYPGCYLRKPGWDLMRLRGSKIDDSLQKVEAGKQILSFVKSEAAAGTLQSYLFHQLHSEVCARHPENVFHDDLAEFNRPYYFLEFAELINKHGLRFMCEADLGGSNLSQSVREELEKLTDDPLELEQYIDFIEFATFRMSLICKKSANISTTPQSSAIRGLHVRTNLRLASDVSTINGETTAKFSMPDGRSININHPLTKSVLFSLGSANTAASEIEDLISSSYGDPGQTFGFLLQLHKMDLIDLFSEPPKAATSPGQFPKARNFVRWQAANGCDSMTSIYGVNIRFDNDLVREMVILLDGSRDRTSIVNDLIEVLRVDEKDRAAAAAQLPGIVDTNLNSFADLGLLIA